MILDLDRQPAGRSELSVSAEVALDLDDGRPPKAMLSGQLTIQNLTGRVLVSGGLRASGTAECGRCLGSFALEWEVPVDLMVLRDVDSDETEGETLLIQQRDGEVDLSDALREFAILAFPQTAVCREDCRGLCPQCGTDRNNGECDCADADTDPRWDGLP